MNSSVVFCTTFPAWIEERLESVYKKDARFNDKSLALFNLDMGAPEVCADPHNPHLGGC